MSLYTYLTGLYDSFLSIFPVDVQWFVTVIVLIALVSLFVNLIRHHWLFVIVLIILLPIVIPVLRHFVGDIWLFVQYLWQIVVSGAPQT